ncbi:8-amino-7-oxononanoate synthase [Oceanisphaera psychrotolerans]|uniref:8-amino-7-oxononanoate synthase n=1 Tax=Oceanisphaera psychrotolerans TaxID=1414654 RepID=A0A1J4QD48_9GAMM|nr:8-amino-7-oxononanoate synthase [Oceanisphaera psychrotolerans]OIN06635.1 8-amino-7-oxononanoate synthase [Oceanisphaera psychrotolerans]
MPFNLSLNEREAAGLKRSLPVIERVGGRQLWANGLAYLNFAGNDYLGLSQAPELRAAADAAAREFGVGAVASPLVVGHQAVHRTLESELADWLGLEAVMLFSSGFSANQAVIKSLLGKEHWLWQDRLNHASLQEAGALSPARMQRFAHNDMAALAAKLKPEAGLIVSEGVFSMDGDQGDWQGLAQLAEQSRNWLMIDDAHGLGVLGKAGRGTLSEQGIAAEQVQITMGTFGKALGVSGAFVGGSRALVDYLHNHARSYVYSTHLPPPQSAAILAAVRLVQQADDQRDRLRQLIRQFREGVAALPFALLPSATAIQPLIVGDENSTLALAARLRERGFWVGAIRPPTVPKGSARLRITLSAAHRSEDITALVGALTQAARQEQR